MSYVTKIINIVLSNIPSEEEVRVGSVDVEAGEITGIVPDYLIKYYNTAVRGTALEGSTLNVEIIPVTAECSACKSIYHPDREHDYLCPACGSGNARIISGRDVQVVRMVTTSEAEPSPLGAPHAGGMRLARDREAVDEGSGACQDRKIKKN